MKITSKLIFTVLLSGFFPLMTQAMDGIGTGLTYTGEGVALWNSEGGDNTVHVLDNLDLQFEFDFESMGLWAGGTGFVYFLSNSGADISTYIGDMQVTSNIEANTSSRLYEFWYNQALWDGRLELLIGFHDLNSEFYTNDCSGLFNNSSFGIGADVAANVPVSIFNLTALGFRVNYQLLDNLNLRAAIYDGDPGDPDVDKGLNIDWDSDQGLMNIAEAQYTMKSRRGLNPSIWRMGTWYHSAEFESLNNDIVEAISGNYGTYLSIDLPLSARMTGFFQGGFAASDRSQVPMYAGYGINLLPFKASRPDDTIGVGVAAAQINGAEHWEMTYEGIWSIQVTDWFTLKSDVQYITRPAGVKADTNVLQLGLRTELSI